MEEEVQDGHFCPSNDPQNCRVSGNAVYCQCIFALDPFPTPNSNRNSSNLNHYCRVCNTQLNSCKQVNIHISGKKHQKRFNYLKYSIDTAQNNILETSPPSQAPSMVISQPMQSQYNPIPNGLEANSQVVPSNFHSCTHKMGPVFFVINGTPTNRPGDVMSAPVLPPPNVPQAPFPPVMPSSSSYFHPSSPHYEYGPTGPPLGHYGQTSPTLTSGLGSSFGDCKSTETGSILSATSYSSLGNHPPPFSGHSQVPGSHDMGTTNYSVMVPRHNSYQPPPFPATSHQEFIMLPPNRQGHVYPPPPTVQPASLSSPVYSSDEASYQMSSLHHALPPCQGMGVARVTSGEESSGSVESNTSHGGEIRCEVCQVSVNSSHQLHAHLAGHKHRLRCLRQGIDPAQSMLLTPFSSASPSRTPSECSYSPKSLQKVPMMTSLLGSPSTDNKTPREVRTSLLETPEQFMQVPSRSNTNTQLLPNKAANAKTINKKPGKKAKDGPTESNATVASKSPLPAGGLLRDSHEPSVTENKSKEIPKSKSHEIIRPSTQQPAVNAAKDSMLQASPMLDKFLQTLDSHPVKGHYVGKRGVEHPASKMAQKI
ncbi:uncharacterized protein LOC131883156 isoform X1 [Tigriopus californicus]|uniref:uncharacterized protein LOC131883156 isoform X1 n=1 Tax=Tigriopus californicus TaxID=6832 RepID=UPI0027DAA096|nr:uncharacterized protein LOC131883156 isoform X1 [Tigriopus californicus]